jgi:hypothetical protein
MINDKWGKSCNFAPRKEQDENDDITSDTSDAGAELPGMDAERGCV